MYIIDLNMLLDLFVDSVFSAGEIACSTRGSST